MCFRRVREYNPHSDWIYGNTFLSLKLVAEPALDHFINTIEKIRFKISLFNWHEERVSTAKYPMDIVGHTVETRLAAGRKKERQTYNKENVQLDSHD